MDAAAALFWEKSYAATTTREIASAVGIQQASLYYHVASKEDLLYQLCISSLEHLLSRIQSAVEEVHDPLERVKVLIRVHLTTLLQHRKRNVTMLTELRALSDRHHHEVAALRKQYANVVSAELEQAQAAGYVRTDIPVSCLYLALLNVLNWALLWFREGQELSAEQLAGYFTTIYLDGTAISSAKAGLRLPQLELGRARTGPKGKGPKRSRTSTATRMVDAAATLFSKKGYSATTTREIAAVLGIQKASLYYHIETKEDLLYAICKSSLEQIHSDVETALAEVRGPLERTGVMIRAHIESLCRDQTAHSTALAEMQALSEERRSLVMALRDGYENLVRSVLQEAQDAGAMRTDIPVKYLCLSLLGLMNRVEVWYRPDGPFTSQELGQVFAIVFLDGAASAGYDDRR